MLDHRPLSRQSHLSWTKCWQEAKSLGSILSSHDCSHTRSGSSRSWRHKLAQSNSNRCSRPTFLPKLLPLSQFVPKVSWGVLHDWLQRSKIYGLVYTWFCTRCWHHFTVEKAAGLQLHSRVSLKDSDEKSFSWVELGTGHDAVHFCLEEEMGRGVDLLWSPDLYAILNIWMNNQRLVRYPIRKLVTKQCKEENIKIFVTYVNAHQKATSTKEDCHNHVKSCYFVDVS